MGKIDPWFDSLYRDHAKRLFDMAYSILNDQAVAEELVQDTFTILLMKRADVEKYENPKAFLTNVMRKRIGNELQRASRRLVEPLDEAHLSTLASEERQESVADILPDWLTPQERQIIIWRADYGLSFQKIALRLGCSEHACHAKMYRLRAKFKKHSKTANSS